MNKQIVLSAAIRLLINLVHWMVLAHLPGICKTYGIDDVAIGTLIGLQALSSMALMLPMGIFSDLFPPKRVLFVGACFFGLYLAALNVITSFVWLLPAVLVGGFGTASLMVVTESLYLKQFGQEKRGSRVAIFQFCNYVGYGLGPLLGGILLTWAPESFFPVAAGGGLFVIILSLFLADSDPIVFSFKDYNQDILRPKPILLIACIFAAGTHFGVEQTSLTLFMKETLTLSAQEIGFVFAGVGFWMAATVPFVGRLHDRRQFQFLFLFTGLAISGFFQFLTAWAGDFRSLLAIRLLHTLGDTFMLLEVSVLAAMLFPRGRLGGNSGLLYGVRTLATFLAALAAGVTNQLWGYGFSFEANGAFVCLFVFAGIFFIISDKKRMVSVGWRRNSQNRKDDDA